MTASEWTQIDEFVLNLSVGPIDVGAPIQIEANGEARRVLMVMREGEGPSILARWRDGVPASLRVFGLPGLDEDVRTAYERQLLDYAAGRREAPAYDIHLDLRDEL